MAVRPVDPGNVELKWRRNATVPTVGAGDVTIMRWVRITHLSTVAFRNLFTISADPTSEFTSDYIWIGTYQSGGPVANALTLEIGDPPTFLDAYGPALDVGMYYHLAYVKSGNVHTLYLSSLDSLYDVTPVATLTNAAGNLTAASIWMNAPGYVEIEHVKIFERALTPADIQAERNTAGIVSTANLFSYASFTDYTAAGLADQSGNGNDWTALLTTPTFGDQPVQVSGPFFTEVMAYTRLYVINGLSALWSPTTVKGTWDITTEFLAGLSLPLSGYKGGGQLPGSSSGSETSVTSGVTVSLERWVSEALEAQTIAGTIDVVQAVAAGQITPGNGLNGSWALHVYVTVGMTDTVRGTLLANYRDPLSNKFPEFGAPSLNGVGWTLTAPQTMTPVACQRGDRLVVELGYVARNTTAVSLGAVSRFGAVVNGSFSPRVDLAPGDTDYLLKAGFFEFSQPILFYEPIPAVGDLLVGNKSAMLYDGVTGEFKRQFWPAHAEAAGPVVADNGHIFWAMERNIPAHLGVPEGSWVAEFDRRMRHLSYHEHPSGSNCHSVSRNTAGDLYSGHGGHGGGGPAAGTPCGETFGTGLASQRKINKLDLSGAFVTDYAAAPEAGGTPAVELAADQSTLYYTSIGRLVKRYDVVGDVQLADFVTLPADGGLARGLRVLPDGGLLVADFVNIKRLNTSAAITHTYNNGTTDWGTLAITVDQAHFWAATTANPGVAPAEITKFRLSDGAVLQTITNMVRDDSPGSLCSGGLEVYGGFRGAVPNPPPGFPPPPPPPPGGGGPPPIPPTPGCPVAWPTDPPSDLACPTSGISGE